MICLSYGLVSRRRGFLEDFDTGDYHLSVCLGCVSFHPKTLCWTALPLSYMVLTWQLVTADGILVVRNFCNFTTFVAGFVFAQLAKAASGNAKHIYLL